MQMMFYNVTPKAAKLICFITQATGGSFVSQLTDLLSQVKHEIQFLSNTTNPCVRLL